MKATVFGCVGFAITVFTTVMVLLICNHNTYESNVRDNLISAMDSSLQLVADKWNDSYSDTSQLSDDESLVADVVANIALYMDNVDNVQVDVFESDVTEGLLVLAVTVDYTTNMGNTATITEERTVLVESFEEKEYVEPTTFDITFKMAETGPESSRIFVSMKIRQNDYLIYPGELESDDSYYYFAGWASDDIPGSASNPLTESDITSLKSTKDYTFYPVYEEY